MSEWKITSRTESELLRDDGYVDNLSWSIEDILFQHFTAITWKNITRPQYEKISWCNNLLRVRDKRLNLCNQSECLKTILLH